MVTSKKFFLLGLVCLCLALLSYMCFDQTIAFWINRHVSSDSSLFQNAFLISAWTSSKQVIFIASIVALIGAWKTLKNEHNSAQKYIYITAVYFMSYLVAFVIKVIVARYRPELLIHSGQYGFSWFSTEHALTSMPSGHTVVWFSLAFSLVSLSSKKARCIGIVLMLCAITVAATRIILDAHFLSDVLVSIVISSWVVSLISRVKADSASRSLK